MESEDEEKDLKAASAPTIEEEVPCVSPPVDEEDDDDEEDNNNDNHEDKGDDDNDNDEEDTNNDKEEDIFDFDLNDVEGMSEYKLMRLQRIHRNKEKLLSLGLLGGMTSNATPSSNSPKRKKHVAPQDDVERRVQPKRIAKKPTSYRDLDDPIDFSDTGEEDTVSKRMDEEAEYIPSGGEYEEDDDKSMGEEDTVRKRMREDGDNVEEYDKDEDELESGEFNSHIFQMSLLSTSGSQPLNPCKCRSSSPR